MRLGEAADLYRYFAMDLCTIEGQFIQHVQPLKLPTPANLNFLKLTFGFHTSEEMEKAEIKASKVVNSLRMMFGIPAAKERQVQSKFSKDDVVGQETSFQGFASYFDAQGLNLFDVPPIEGAILRPMTDGTATLLDSAFSQHYPEVQFVLMWLALESIINSHAGGGSNGEKRKRYFLIDLGSSAANEEVKLLHNLRNNIFKEANFLPQAHLSMATWSLYWVIQLAILDDCPQRDQFVRGFELFLSTERKNSKDWSTATSAV